MSNYTDSTLPRQENTLTKKQRALIDSLLERCSHIPPEQIDAYYDHYCYARNWHVFISESRGEYATLRVITRCDWKHTAQAKVEQIRAYIASKQGGAA